MGWGCFLFKFLGTFFKVFFFNFFNFFCFLWKFISLSRMHNWNGDWLSIWYGEHVFISCCGLCCFWKLKCGDLLSCCDLSLAFFGLVLYFTEKFHSLIPEGQKVSLLEVFNLRVEIVSERLSWTWSVVLMCTQKCGNHLQTSSVGTDLKIDLQQLWWQI